MSKQRTIRTNYRRSPMAASRANKETSLSAQVQLDFVAYEIKQTVIRETKPPPTLTETAEWLSSTLRTYKNFAWDYYLPSEGLIMYLKTSGGHRNAFVHFKNHFSATSKQFGWNCSGKDLQEAWRYAPKDLKATWNSIFQVNKNTNPTKASSGKRRHMETPNLISSYVNCEPIQFRMPVASTSNAGLYNSPDFRGSWNSPPTYFDSPPPNHDVTDAGWHDFYEGYPSITQAGAEIPCYLPPSLSQEWTPLTSYLPSGYSSPASATSPYSNYSGVYFTGTPSSPGSSYRPPSEHLGGSSDLDNGSLPIHQPSYDQYPVVSDHYSQWDTITNTQTKDHAGSWDPLSHQTQPYPSPPSRDFIPNLSHTVPRNNSPDLGTAFEHPSLFNFLEDCPEGSVQTGSSIEDLLASLNGPVEGYSTFHAEGIEPVLDLAAPMSQGPWPTYEVSPGYLPETGEALGCHPQSSPRYLNEANFEST